MTSSSLTKLVHLQVFSSQRQVKQELVGSTTSFILSCKPNSYSPTPPPPLTAFCFVHFTLTSLPNFFMVSFLLGCIGSGERRWSSILGGGSVWLYISCSIPKLVHNNVHDCPTVIL
eukprot:m.7390 g.7390  ORF g.7390 m.7390 type:complete len:116 (-) comp2790_c0_seq1:710-1057(-)